MQIQWQSDQPIYRQLRERMVQMILDGLLAEGEALPGVRKVAAELQLNPLTVMKGYQELVEEQIVEKKRGLGMFVREGAREQLLANERERFLSEDWPRILARIESLGLRQEDLLAGVKGGAR
ncbi:MAG: GntR family transcriptional regulator [Calditrichaeota bacterium]|nr:GntR family transcriptional regulator [Candidatus Cloacimonadota bacterium]MCB1047030.1 GntR family transcriptional regulator [Calditrichota bacterium]MCB9472942.1 GntR family transcriptional regulator [Candidatus Delongbacteria bacterium]